MTGKPTSPLGLAAKAVLDISVEREACPMHLAPTSSTVNTLMMGDALAMETGRGVHLRAMCPDIAGRLLVLVHQNTPAQLDYLHYYSFVWPGCQLKTQATASFFLKRTVCGR